MNLHYKYRLKMPVELAAGKMTFCGGVILLNQVNQEN